VKQIAGHVVNLRTFQDKNFKLTYYSIV